MKQLALLGLATLLGVTANADILRVESFDHYGPYRLATPMMVDSVDVNSKKFSDTNLSSHPKNIRLNGVPVKVSGLVSSDSPTVGMLSFSFENTSYASPEIKVNGLKNYAVYVDGKKVDGSSTSLRPATHNLVVRYLLPAGESSDSLSVELKAKNESGLAVRNDGKRRFSLDDVLHGNSVNSVSISPDGNYIITANSVGRKGGSSSRSFRVTRLSDGRVVAERGDYLSWMPKGSRYYFTRANVDGHEIVAVDATTGIEEVVVAQLPEEGGVQFTPDEKKLIVYTRQEGRKEDPKVYQILQPEDRQPGWRNRSGVAIMDIASGVVNPLTFGNRNVYVNDISDDSRKLLLASSRSRLEKRPTTVTSLFVLNLDDMSVDTLVNEGGFLGSACFSPDAKSVLISGNPEAFEGIGKSVPEGRIPSMTQNELFMIDVASHAVKPLTVNFNPSVENFQWSRADGQIYFRAEDRDCINVFRLNPKTGVIAKLNLPEENISSFSLPDTGKMMAWIGQSASKPSSLYTFDCKTQRSTLLSTPKKEQLADVALGECNAWDFVNSRGDTICGRFYLPPDFDSNKKYPMIVNYYGGCSPTSRLFESRYPHNAYAAQGYVVYVVIPSGATGFGQEFSSRHVNTAGQGVAEDIIEGTKKFCEEHPYVDAKKIGCIGASYGGFMTQYLQTVTDIFAAAISHAGISDHTSYWGEGYWGYSYSEVSMAESYPWTDPDLYVKQSPLYNAHKIKTPLLFLHGDKDNNVPVGESIQMFTALKLLNRPTAFVAVADQDHHILDYDKRIKWQDTIFAWFSKYLKDDSEWWDAMYPQTPL